jgi:hypothetical protein
MQEQNNFERQVKETMDGFSIQPSAPVWEKVEREIRQKKERRRLVLWILPLLLAGGLWLALLQNHADEKQDTAVNTVNAPAAADEKEAPKGPLSPIELTEQEKTLPAIQSKKGSAPITVNETNELTSVKNTRTKDNSSKAVTRKNISHKQQLNVSDPSGETELTGDKKTNAPASKGTNEISAPAQTDKPKEASTVSQPVEIKQNENLIETKQDPPLDSASVAPKSEAVEPVSRPRKWKISLQVTGGYAQTMRSFFPLAAASESNIVPNAIGFTPRVGPREATPGASFSGGIILSTSLTTKLKFNTGIHYNYASTKQPYGEKSVGNWYGVSPTADSGTVLLKTGNANIYTNRYHFIEVPAGITYRLFTTLPVELHTGVSLTALVASNAVQFDESYDLFYTQKNKLQSLGANAFAGFSYSLAKERLKIGPHIQYSILPVHRKDDKRYLLTGGIRATLSLN